MSIHKLRNLSNIKIENIWTGSTTSNISNVNFKNYKLFQLELLFRAGRVDKPQSLIIAKDVKYYIYEELGQYEHWRSTVLLNNDTVIFEHQHITENNPKIIGIL